MSGGAIRCRLVSGRASCRSGTACAEENSRASFPSDGRSSIAERIGSCWYSGATDHPTLRNSPPFSMYDSDRSGRMTIFVAIAITQLTQ